MTVADRRERHRAQRRELIVRAARELAEAQGWDAVTTRRLAERIEYSQPVLYGHFPGGRDAIVGAVALEGFAELVRLQRRRTAPAPGPEAALAAAARAYLDFAAAHPAVYEAMFALSTDLPFAQPDTPPPLLDAFDLLRDALGAATGAQDLDLRTELAWGALHGLVGLSRTGRLPDRHHERRLQLLLAQWTSTTSPRGQHPGGSGAGAPAGGDHDASSER